MIIYDTFWIILNSNGYWFVVLSLNSFRKLMYWCCSLEILRLNTFMGTWPLLFLLDEYSRTGSIRASYKRNKSQVFFYTFKVRIGLIKNVHFTYGLNKIRNCIFLGFGGVIFDREQRSKSDLKNYCCCCCSSCCCSVLF